MYQKLNFNFFKFLSKIRIEDLLCVMFVIGIFYYGGTQVISKGLTIGESDLWDFSLYLFPFSLVIFLLSLRYAIYGGASFQNSVYSIVIETIRDWLPFFLFLFFYEIFATSFWSAISKPDLDSKLLAWDRFLFGETPSVWMDRWVQPWLTDILAVAYFLHVVLPLIISYACYRKNKPLFRYFLLAFLLGGILGNIGYIFVPGVGPNIAYPQLYAHGLNGAFYGSVAGILDIVRAPRDIFPSLHVCLSTIVLWCGAKLGRKWLWFLLPLVLGNWISTIYLRYHYMVDVIVGFALAFLVLFLAKWLLLFEKRFRTWIERVGMTRT
ncbi:MAG: phosphatase PAP2 family protein [Candidatus Aminicenantes bacterium]|nr:phosphatase PAP2 family protein [Candidatus Aminicenantes bacterium]